MHCQWLVKLHDMQTSFLIWIHCPGLADIKGNEMTHQLASEAINLASLQMDKQTF